MVKEESKMNPIDRILYEAGLPNPLDVLPTPRVVSEKLDIPTLREVAETISSKLKESFERKKGLF